ncbi:phosphatidylserine decarboxylase [Candidatus Hepatobacter penaei]|uniref:phosphatidylserine decarboxylase n=1 Tax=Candidatus Hepatobacter penaei TaxID=1274402 RepID=UPI0004F2B761|nr:phosphatidylserine decarboxylase [Candidatus Hepatobacter penaei]TGW14633.1 phosphatidylserine decarboxylase [bacterium NHP-B]
MMLSWGPLKGRIHPAGWSFITLGAGLSILFLFVWPVVGVLALVLTLGCAAFFRDPERVGPKSTQAIVSPADGVLVDICHAKPPAEVGRYREGNWVRLSIFLSLFDAHVTRMPQKGRVLMTTYHKGQFFNASLDKASQKNERNTVVLEAEGTTMMITQIAGLIARRIVCDVSIGDQVMRGQAFGIIRFGSRVDVYLPDDVEIFVQKGQKMVSGETVLAKRA